MFVLTITFLYYVVPILHLNSLEKENVGIELLAVIEEINESLFTIRIHSIKYNSDPCSTKIVSFFKSLSRFVFYLYIKMN